LGEKKNNDPKTNFNIGCLKNSKLYRFLLMCKFSQLATPSLLSKTHFANYKVPYKEERKKKQKNANILCILLIRPEEINQLA